MCCHRERSTVGMNMTSGAVMMTECNPQAVRTREIPLSVDHYDGSMAHIWNTGIREVHVQCVGLSGALCTRGSTSA